LSVLAPVELIVRGMSSLFNAVRPSPAQFLGPFVIVSSLWRRLITRCIDAASSCRDMSALRRIATSEALFARPSKLNAPC